MQRNGQIDESNNDFFMQSLTNRVIESSSHRSIAFATNKCRQDQVDRVKRAINKQVQNAHHVHDHDDHADAYKALGDDRRVCEMHWSHWRHL